MFWSKRNFVTNGLDDFSARAEKSLLGITCAGKRDGGGAQVQAVMSALLFSQATGVPYFHSPFNSVHHGADAAVFADEWEAAFNLGFGKPGVPDDVPTVSAKTFSRGRYWGRVIVSEKYFHGFAEKNLHLYPSLAEELRGHLSLPQRSFEKPTIAVHIRRGDVACNPSEIQRLTVNSTVLANVRSVLSEHPNHRALIFSQGELSDFGELAEICDFELNSNIFATVSGMIAADCLIMAKSSLSYVAGLFSKGIVYYEPFWHGPIPSWRILPKSA